MSAKGQEWFLCKLDVLVCGPLLNLTWCGKDATEAEIAEGQAALKKSLRQAAAEQDLVLRQRVGKSVCRTALSDIPALQLQEAAVAASKKGGGKDEVGSKEVAAVLEYDEDMCLKTVIGNEPSQKNEYTPVSWIDSMTLSQEEAYKFELLQAMRTLHAMIAKAGGGQGGRLATVRLGGLC